MLADAERERILTEIEEANETLFIVSVIIGLVVGPLISDRWID